MTECTRLPIVQCICVAFVLYLCCICAVFVLRLSCRRLEELQDALSSSTQRIGKLQETAETDRERMERETEAEAARHATLLAAAADRAAKAVSLTRH